jgi:hypothetical protein
MTDSGRTTSPEVLVAGGQDLDTLLASLAAYLHALEARVAALERRSSAVPLMTAADAARYAQVNVETILRAVRAGELPVAGCVVRSPPDLTRCPQPLARHRLTGGAGFSATPPGSRAAGRRCRRGGMQALG